MFLFSFLKKKKKQGASTNNDNVEEAKEAIKIFSTPSIEHDVCVLSDAAIEPTRAPTRMLLLQGSSDSKIKQKKSTPQQQPSACSAISKHIPVTNITLQQSSSITTHVKSLYPRLDIVDKSLDEPSKVSDPKVRMKSIHDMAGEIQFRIHARIHHANMLKNAMNAQTTDPKKEVLAIMSTMPVSSNFEYSFYKELSIRNKFSHINDYKKLNSFEDAKVCHEAASRSKNKMSYNPTSVPIFQNYYKSLRCYRGQKSDIIDCD